MTENKTIWLIDDDYATNYYHRLLFESLELSDRLVIFQNAADALDALQQGNIPTLIFLDLNMPRICGREFLKQFPKELYEKVSIIILSTLWSPTDEKKLLTFAPVKRIEQKPLGEISIFTSLTLYT